ncbi:MAG: hypothetical protein AAFP87_04840 [Pseudomonadota bacterium]
MPILGYGPAKSFVRGCTTSHGVGMQHDTGLIPHDTFGIRKVESPIQNNLIDIGFFRDLHIHPGCCFLPS